MSNKIIFHKSHKLLIKRKAELKSMDDMRIILDQWKIGNYTILELDDDPPMKPYSKYKIDGIAYKTVPVYDLPKSIAVENDGDFKGKTVEFI